MVNIKDIPCPYCGADLERGRQALEEHLEVCSSLPKTGTVYPPREVPQKPNNDEEASS